jgi:hypothetical protein
MAISQISSSNTFAQWLTATQSLIQKQNYYEDTVNLVFETANAVFNSANVIANSEILILETANGVYDEANIIYNTANTVYNTNNAITNTATIIFNYVGNSYNVANAVFLTANLAYAHSNGAYNHANAAYSKANTGFDHANGMYNRANTAANHANGAFVTANSGFDHANGMYFRANTAADHANAAFFTANIAYELVNTALQVVFNIEDETEDANTYYPTLVPVTAGIPSDAYISSTKLYYVPLTGQLSATNFNSLSDINKKNNIITLEHALDSVMNMRGVSFTWKDSQEKSIGVIAQEIEQIVPEVVSTNEHGEKSVSYGNIVGLLIQAIKELKKELDDLKDIINKTK